MCSPDFDASISLQFTCILIICFQDFEKELEDRKKQEEDEQVTGWNAVEIDETPVNITVSNKKLYVYEILVSGNLMLHWNSQLHK